MAGPGPSSCSTSPASRAWDALRHVWASGVRCPNQTVFAIAISLTWALLYNVTFWRVGAQAMWYQHLGAPIFFASLFILVVVVQATLLLIVPTARGMQVAASVLFIVSALSAYFSASYGTVMNSEMMRNVAQTDPAEVRGLLNPELLLYVAVLGGVPAILVWRVVLPRTSFLRQLRQRAIFLVIAWVLAAGTMLAASANYAVFLREHKPIRSLVTPTAAVVSSVSVLMEQERTHYSGPLIEEGGPARRIAALGHKPVLLFLVIGETARAANFELGGYPRATNPLLKREPDVVYFTHATSCGTSTATSVPCIFSPFGRARFDLALVDRYVNLLDTLKSVGLDVQWRDNNAGCKGVCKRIQTISYSARPDPKLCPHSYCFDEVMLQDLAERLKSITSDTVIVFHGIGSHGPAYAERYPSQFEHFRPDCRSNELHRCPHANIVNAYDNSIVYTDYVLSRQIDLLRGAADTLDGALIYASDHGESLGENGVYLHGLPYSMAPRTQTQIPLLIWTSQAYRRRSGLDERCLEQQAQRQSGHDNIYHTVLGVFGVSNGAYDRSLDLLDGCRQAAGYAASRTTPARDVRLASTRVAPARANDTGTSISAPPRFTRGKRLDAPGTTSSNTTASIRTMVALRPTPKRKAIMTDSSSAASSATDARRTI